LKKILQKFPEFFFPCWKRGLSEILIQKSFVEISIIYDHIIEKQEYTTMPLLSI